MRGDAEDRGGEGRERGDTLEKGSGEVKSRGEEVGMEEGREECQKGVGEGEKGEAEGERRKVRRGGDRRWRRSGAGLTMSGSVRRDNCVGV